MVTNYTFAILAALFIAAIGFVLKDLVVARKQYEDLADGPYVLHMWDEEFKTEYSVECKSLKDAQNFVNHLNGVNRMTPSLFRDGTVTHLLNERGIFVKVKV